MCSGAIKTIVKMEKGVGDQELRTIIHTYSSGIVAGIATSR